MRVKSLGRVVLDNVQLWNSEHLTASLLVQQASEGGGPSDLLRAEGGAVLTIPGNLGLSAGGWLKLLLRLVDTVCGFLKVRPMASIDWLLLRITRYGDRRGGGDTFRWP